MHEIEVYDALIWIFTKGKPSPFMYGQLFSEKSENAQNLILRVIPLKKRTWVKARLFLG